MQQRWIRLGTAGLGLIGVLFARRQGLAQTPVPATVPQRRYLTVRPHDAATGTQNPAAGVYPLPGFLVTIGDDTIAPTVYVPQQCVGERRCPVVVSLNIYDWENGSSRQIDWKIALANEYGVLLILFNPYPLDHRSPRYHIDHYNEGFRQFFTRTEFRASALEHTTWLVDTTLQQTLQQFAVDPEKIAVIGGGDVALDIGRNNLDVFSRIAVFQPNWGRSVTAMPEAHPPHTQTQYFITSGFEPNFGQSGFRTAEVLRAEGAPVQYVFSLKYHEHRQEENEAAFRWFRQSWAAPDSVAAAVRAAVPAVADSLPLLTPQALTQLAAFWTVLKPLDLSDDADDSSAVKEIDSLRMGGELPPVRRAYLRFVTLPVGQQPAAFWLTDIGALAAKYPKVADALTAAGLTASQEEADRAAFLSALATIQVATEWNLPSRAKGTANVAPPPATVAVVSASVLGRNVAFLEAHMDDPVMRELRDVLWVNP